MMSVYGKQNVFISWFRERLGFAGHVTTES